MATVYIEARPKGRAEGSPIDDYVVEDHADHALPLKSAPSTGLDVSLPGPFVGGALQLDWE